MATVFAQLVVGGEEHGVHAVLVPIRDEDGAICPGVRIGDCGAKMGLEGVDNGRLWFDSVRVPRDHLLGRFASIDDAGQYQSQIPSASRRFLLRDSSFPLAMEPSMPAGKTRVPQATMRIC